MATRRSKGHAVSIAEVTYLVYTDIVTGDGTTLTINNKSLGEVLATTDTLSDFVTSIVTAWNASVIPEFAEMTAAAVTASNNEIQRLTISNATGGTFLLTFDGDQTSALAYNITSTALKTALEALDGIASGDVNVTGPDGGPFEITFQGNLAHTNVSLVLVDDSSLTGGGSQAATIALVRPGGDVVKLTGDTKGKPFTITVTTHATGGIDEVTVVTLGNTPTGGTFTLTISDGTNEETTGTIAYNAAAATVQTAILALSFLDTSDCVVTGSAGGPWTLTWGDDVASTNMAVSADRSGLTGGDAIVTITETLKGLPTQNEVQTITMYGTITAGTYTLSFNGSTTTALAYNANNAAIEAALEALPGIIVGDLTMGGGPLPGTPVTVTFGGSLAGTDVAMLSVNPSNLVNTIGASIAETVKGVSGGDEKVYFMTEKSDVSYAYFDLTGNTGTSAGTFTITFEGQTTAAIAYDADAYTILVALEALSNVTAGDILHIESPTTNTLAGGASANTMRFHVGPTLGDSTITVSLDSTGLTGGNYSVADTDGDQSSAAGLQVSGTFALQVGTGGTPTAALAHNITAAALQTALEGLAEIGTGNVSVTRRDHTGGDELYTWLITFQNDKANTDIDQIYATSLLSQARMSTGGPRTQRDGGTGNVNEKQTITVSGTPAQGTFTATFEGQVATLNYDDTATEVETALAALSSIGTGNVDVTGGPLPGTAVVAEFIGALAATDVNLMTLDDTLLQTKIVETTPGSPGQDEKQTLSISGQSVFGGTTTLTQSANTTGNINWNAENSDVKTALEALAHITAGDLTCAGGPWPDTDITVTFGGTLTQTDVGAITDTPSFNNGTVTVTTTTDGSPGDTGTVVTSTAATGRYHWDDANNWSGNTLPVSTDTVVFDQGDVSMKYGLAQSAVALTNLEFTQEYSGEIGLPEKNTDNTSDGGDYFEYRNTNLQIQATNVTIGRGDPDKPGSSRINLDLGSTQTTVNVFNTGLAPSDRPYAVYLIATHASNEVNVYKGTVGIGTLAGDAATVATLRVGYVDQIETDASVVCGDGVTLTNVDQTGGSLTIESATTTVDMTGGSLTVLAGAHAALDIQGGTVYYQSTGTITAVTVGDGGVLDFSQDMRTRTVTNCTLGKGATLRDPFKTVTFTNAVILDNCGFEDVTIDLGEHLTVQRGAVP